MLRRHFARPSMLALVALVSVGTAAAAGNHGKVGSTLTVKGQTKDVVAVTVLKVQDPATGYSVPAGKRVVGVTFKVKNVGKFKYDDFPTALLTTADGESSGSAISTGGSCNRPGAIKLKPGGDEDVLPPVPDPKNGRVVTIQYEPDGGYGTPAVFAVK